MGLFAPLFSALNGTGVRYVVVGGLAVVLHGHPRLTGDVDIVLDLEPTAARRALEALVALGMRARAPVDPITFADPVSREDWIARKGMEVFSLSLPENPMLNVDLFVREPLPFEDLWRRAETIDVGEATIRIASIEDLILMKRAAARPQDLSDIEALEEIRRRGRPHG